MSSELDSAWKSGYKTGKRLRLDWTITDQDWKIPRPIKTVTAVQSLVHHHFRIFKTDKNGLNWYQPVFLALSMYCILQIYVVIHHVEF